MQRSEATPKTSRIHRSMDFALSEELLHRAMAASGVEELRVGFARFIGSAFPGMPRPGTICYPVLAMFYLPAGRRYRTFDRYELEAGITALVYPVYRSQKSSVQAALLEQAVPAMYAWVAESRGGEKPSSFYVVHDQTFHEIVFGLNQIVEGNAGSRLRLAEDSRVIVSLRSGAVRLRRSHEAFRA